MPHDPQKVADTQQWLSRAFSDLASAEVLAAATPARMDTAVFHCQQAAEKSLKAFLFWHGIPFRKTHDIEEIGQACLAIDESLREVVDRATDLTPYAWCFRYPGDTTEPSRADVDLAMAIAREVYQTVLARLPEKVRP